VAHGLPGLAVTYDRFVAGVGVVGVGVGVVVGVTGLAGVGALIQNSMACEMVKVNDRL
jgi:hypothetical protein